MHYNKSQIRLVVFKRHSIVCFNNTVPTLQPCKVSLMQDFKGWKQPINESTIKGAWQMKHHLIILTWFLLISYPAKPYKIPAAHFNIFLLFPYQMSSLTSQGYIIYKLFSNQHKLVWNFADMCAVTDGYARQSILKRLQIIHAQMHLIKLPFIWLMNVCCVVLLYMYSLSRSDS